MSINGWTYLVIKILIFMKCAYVFAEQCSSKLKETPQIYGHAAGSERDCGPAGVRGGAGGRRLGGPPAAQLPRLVPRPPLPPHLLRRHLPATSTLSTSATRRRTSTGGTRTIRTWPVPSNKCTKMRPHRQPEAAQAGAVRSAAAAELSRLHWLTARQDMTHNNRCTHR